MYSIFHIPNYYSVTNYLSSTDWNGGTHSNHSLEVWWKKSYYIIIPNKYLFTLRTSDLQKQPSKKPHTLTSLKTNFMTLDAAMNFIILTGCCGQNPAFPWSHSRGNANDEFHKIPFTLKTSDFQKAVKKTTTYSQFTQGKLHDSKCSDPFHYAYWRLWSNILLFYGA